MLVYVVRVKDTKELVGVFWASDIYEMWCVVDEKVSPTCCEYRSARPGGVYCFSKLPPMASLDVVSDLDAEDYETRCAAVSWCEWTLKDIFEDTVKGRKWRDFPSFEDFLTRIA